MNFSRDTIYLQSVPGNVDSKSLPLCRPPRERLAAHVLPHPYGGYGGRLPLRGHLPRAEGHGQPQAFQAPRRPRHLQRRPGCLQPRHALGGMLDLTHIPSILILVRIFTY